MAARLHWWAVLLSAYHYDIQFKQTKEHTHADGLSRFLPLKNEQLVHLSSETQIFNIGQFEVLPITVQQIEQATCYYAVISKVLMFTKIGCPAQTEQLSI